MYFVSSIVLHKQKYLRTRLRKNILKIITRHLIWEERNNKDRDKHQFIFRMALMSSSWNNYCSICEKALMSYYMKIR